MIKLVDFSKARIIKTEDGKPIKNDGVIYEDETEMIASFQKRSDIQSLEKIMQKLGLEIDLKACDISGYDTPDYDNIKKLMKEGKEFSEG